MFRGGVGFFMVELPGFFNTVQYSSKFCIANLQKGKRGDDIIFIFSELI